VAAAIPAILILDGVLRPPLIGQSLALIAVAGLAMEPEELRAFVGLVWRGDGRRRGKAVDGGRRAWDWLGRFGRRRTGRPAAFGILAECHIVDE
jgi:hypothetical protein